MTPIPQVPGSPSDGGPPGPDPAPVPPRAPDRPEIDRREAIRRVSFLLGGASLVGGSGLLAACEGADRTSSAGQGIGGFTPEDIALLDEVAETILPETDTPGAKAAQVGAFMALMVTDTYDLGEQEVFRAGMDRVDEECRSDHGLSFLNAGPDQRLALLERLDQEQAEHEARRGTDPGSTDRPHYFRMMKELTLLGYFTSEVGCTVAQRYVEAPGRYEPCIPYAPGETSWANHA
ncbi:MAG: gluconate 2-dehydrogenase subunit 3 family protein [Gemmatimonadales bacterium]|nr:MAG: gluconate 2-dehydrogenase subunit 3 family protein [Gemmatimonadales bacterium]